MNLTCQADSLNTLKFFADTDRHSILIDGPAGCGKSYLAKQYQKFLNVEDFALVQPTVQSIRDTLDYSYNLESPVVFCIENLDSGALTASYTLLKFLEEPTNLVYLIVTCRNINDIPATIISRCTCISALSPSSSDLVQYAEIQDFARFQTLKDSELWKSVRTFKDVDYVMKMKQDQLAYFESLRFFSLSDTIQNLSWKLGHFDDNSNTELSFVMNYIISVNDSPRIRKYAIECCRDLSSGRVASHAVLSKFLFECKYGD